ncbi:MAG: acylphosphatase [Cyanobacteriota bacterium]|nr:acylphosphatase [Cyanobacteriota bacterium]
MDSSERSRRLADSPLGGMPGDGLGPARRLRARRLAADERRFLQPSEARPAPPQERWRLLVRGRVQGVGYRAGCSRRAHELGVGGWVRNRPDGSVEVEAEGTPQQLTEFRLWCERGPLLAHVTAVESTQIPGRGDDWFEIRR